MVQSCTEFVSEWVQFAYPCQVYIIHKKMLALWVRKKKSLCTDCTRCLLMFFEFERGTWSRKFSTRTLVLYLVSTTVLVDMSFIIKSSTLMLPGSVMKDEAASIASRSVLWRDYEQVERQERKKTCLPKICQSLEAIEKSFEWLFQSGDHGRHVQVHVHAHDNCAWSQ